MKIIKYIPPFEYNVIEHGQETKLNINSLDLLFMGQVALIEFKFSSLDLIIHGPVRKRFYPKVNLKEVMLIEAG